MNCRIRMSGGPRHRLAALLATAALCMSPALGSAPAVAAPRHADAPATTLIDIPDCSAFLGARKLGGKIRVPGQTVFACGPRPNYSSGLSKLINVLAIVFPYHLSIARYPGYQCVELTARYLAAAYGARTGPGVVNGAQVVDDYAHRYPRLFAKFSNGNRKHPPRHGDVLSFATNRHFTGIGHTGVVKKAHIGKRGNGWVRLLEENYGGKSGAKGLHKYPVRNFRVIWKQKPFVKWLHRRG